MELAQDILMLNHACEVVAGHEEESWEKEWYMLRRRFLESKAQLQVKRWEILMCKLALERKIF